MNEMLKITPPETAAPISSDSGGRPVTRALKAIVQFVLMIAVLAGAVTAMNMMIASAPERPTRPPFKTVFPITAAEVEFADHTPTISVYGEAVTARSVDLRPLVSGEIIEVSANLTPGARVDAGETLVVIDRFTYEGALAEARANLAQTEATIAEIEARIASETQQLAASESQLELAESDLARAQSLSATGSMTQKQMEDRSLIVSQREQAVSLRESNLRIEAARLDQQKAAIERLAWKVRQAERSLQDTVLKAPFAGVVRQESADVGKTVSLNDVLATIYSDQNLEARFTLTDAQYGRLVTDQAPLIGRPVTATWTVGGESYVYAGRVVRLGAEVASVRGGVEIFASLDAANEAVQLRPGAFLDITMPDRTYSASVRIPETAIYDGAFVYAIEDGALARREVKVAAFDGQDAIVTEGLVAGEQVMATRLSEVEDGLAVSVEEIVPSPASLVRSDDDS